MSVFHYREVPAPVRPRIADAIEFVVHKCCADLNLEREKSVRQIAWIEPDPSSDLWIDHPPDRLYLGFALLDGTILLARHGTDELYWLMRMICNTLPHELRHRWQDQNGMEPSEDDAKRYGDAVTAHLSREVFKILFEQIQITEAGDRRQSLMAARARLFQGD